MPFESLPKYRAGNRISGRWCDLARERQHRWHDDGSDDLGWGCDLHGCRRRALRDGRPFDRACAFCTGRPRLVRGKLGPEAAHDGFSHYDGPPRGHAGEMQRLLIVEFGTDVGKGKRETIVTRLHREGVTIEVVPVSPHE